MDAGLLSLVFAIARSARKRNDPEAEVMISRPTCAMEAYWDKQPEGYWVRFRGEPHPRIVRNETIGAMRNGHPGLTDSEIAKLITVTARLEGK